MKKLLLIPLAALCVGGLTCCKKDVDVAENQINIKMHEGGYGTKWMYNLVDKFNAKYAEQKYKVNLLRPSSVNEGSTTLNELKRGYAKCGIDIYFSANLSPITLFNERDGVKESDMTPLDDIVYNKKALKLDGTEEDAFVKDKLDSSFGDEWYKYNGKTYGFFYQKSVGALVVNYDKFQKALPGAELPVTTNEFEDQIHAIARKWYDEEISQQPIVYVGANNNGYPAVMLYNFYTQLAGIDDWNQFWSLTDDKGNPEKELDQVLAEFNNPAIDEAAKVVFEVLDSKNLVSGSTAQDFDLSKAHGALMSDFNKKGGIFMFDGDWCLNECATDYESKLSQLRFINTPVISKLGTELWSYNGWDDDECDEVLSAAVRAIDEDKTIDQVIATVKEKTGKDVTSDEVLRVAKARGVYCNRGQQTGTAYVPGGINDTHKEIVGLFLRMMAGDEFANMYFQDARCFSPYGSASAVDQSSLYEFSKGHSKIVTNKYAESIWPIASKFRSKISALGSFFPTSVSTNLLHLRAVQCSSEYTGYEQNYSLKGDYKDIYANSWHKEFESNITFIQKNWESWTKNL